MADVHITEYTDPGCPWAYSAEPFRHRIDWLYEGRVVWVLDGFTVARSFPLSTPHQLEINRPGGSLALREAPRRTNRGRP